MPAFLLPVTHIQQSDEGFCLPACAQMVIRFQGRHLTEEFLADIFQATAPAGAVFSSVSRLEHHDCRVRFGSLTPEQLRVALQRGLPVICRLWTVMLDYWAEDTPHVAVVVGYDGEYVYLNDPAFAEAPQRVLWDGFLAAWEEYDRMAAIIRVL